VAQNCGEFQKLFMRIHRISFQFVGLFGGTHKCGI